MNDAEMPSERADIAKALHRAFSLGQTYWQQADSESYKQNKKADGTAAEFRALVDETVAAISVPAPSGARKPEYGYTEAFYEISALLGIGAQDATPEMVFKTQMLPKLRALITRAETLSQAKRATEPATSEKLSHAETPAEAARQPLTCIWTKQFDGPFDTSCGNAFQFTDCIEENNFKFCCYCGGAIEAENITGAQGATP